MRSSVLKYLHTIFACEYYQPNYGSNNPFRFLLNSKETMHFEFSH